MHQITTENFMDLSIPSQAYLLGFLQTDGHHSHDTRNRGRVRIELSEGDAPFLYELQRVIPYKTSIASRTRDTNFRQNVTSYALSLFAREAREKLLKAGLPVGRKSDSVAPPSVTFSARDYMRGLVDGDGSVGFTKTNSPFVGFVTASQPLRDFFCATLFNELAITRNPNRNARDGVYNILVSAKQAIRFASWLYQPGDLALGRKAETAKRIVIGATTGILSPGENDGTSTS